MKKINIAVFASGNGTNAEKIFEYFSVHNYIKVKLLVCNKKNAPVIEKASKFKIEVAEIVNNEWNEPENILNLLQQKKIDFIVLAGFLKLVPEEIVNAFENRILNIHPALLPKFGGHGMYGSKVHEAVLKAKEKESGITIHLVNNEYDKGKILLQKSCSVNCATDSATEISQKIQALEHLWYPQTIEQYINIFTKEINNL